MSLTQDRLGKNIPVSPKKRKNVQLAEN